VKGRPRRLVLVTGTGTEIGKTWFAAATLEILREQGARVAARKPVQSFDAGDDSTDADVLAAASGERPAVVCLPHRSLAVPMAPPMAADALGAPPFTVADLAGELCWHDGVDVGVVEGVGGPRSPLAGDGDTVTLAEAIGADLVVLVADAGLGTINAVRLSAAPFGSNELIVALNRYDEGDDLHRRNRDWLVERDGFGVVVSPSALAAHLSP
jgi:dethiobiotin synthetase